MFSTHLIVRQDEERKTGFYPLGDFDYIKNRRLKVVKHDPEGKSPEYRWFSVAKRWKKYKCRSEDEWINKILYIHTMEYISP